MIRDQRQRLCQRLVLSRDMREEEEEEEEEEEGEEEEEIYCVKGGCHGNGRVSSRCNGRVSRFNVRLSFLSLNVLYNRSVFM